MRFLFGWILGERGRRVVIATAVGLLWSAPAAAIVFDLPAWRVRHAESLHATAWVTVLLLLVMTALITYVIEDVLGQRRAISFLRWFPSAVALALTASLAITYPSRGERSGNYALDIETFAAIIIFMWAVRRWRRDRTAPLAEAIAVRSVHGRRSPARRD
jgi:hypothetical protein